MVESVSASWWVTERSRDGLKGKAERGPKKELEVHIKMQSSQEMEVGWERGS